MDEDREREIKYELMERVLRWYSRLRALFSWNCISCILKNRYTGVEDFSSYTALNELFFIDMIIHLEYNIKICVTSKSLSFGRIQRFSLFWEVLTR